MSRSDARSAPAARSQFLAGAAEIHANLGHGVGAVVTHVRRKEYPTIIANLVLLGLADFVAWGLVGRGALHVLALTLAGAVRREAWTCLAPTHPSTSGVCSSRDSHRATPLTWQTPIRSVSSPCHPCLSFPPKRGPTVDVVIAARVGRVPVRGHLVDVA